MEGIKQIIANISDSIPVISSSPDIMLVSNPWWQNINVTTIVSVIVFIVGFKVKDLIEKSKKQKELDLYKMLIVEWIKDSKNSIDQYTISLGEFAQKIKVSDSFDKIPYNTNLLCFQKLNSLPVEKLTDALLINHRFSR